MRAALALLVLSLLACAPQMLLGDWRGTEARRVQIAREMAASGDWMVPALGGEVNFAKPPLYYWLLASLQGWSRDAALMRLPSVLAFWLLATAGWRLLRRHYGELAGWMGACGILLAPAVLEHAPYAEIDGVFAALTGLSILWLSEGAAFGQRGRIVAAGLVGGLALLTKGPPYLMFLAGTALVWGRRLRLAGVVWFVPALLLPPLAYYVPLLAESVTWEELRSVAGRESFARLADVSWPHVAGTPAYFARALLLLMPFGLWTFHEFRGGWEMREAVLPKDEALLRMCAGAMVGGVVLLAAFAGRPSRYLLPGVPLFVVALAPALASYVQHDGPARRLGVAIQVLGVLCSIALVCAPWLPYPYHQLTPWLLLAGAVAPLLVRVRRHVVAYALVVPLVAGLTTMLDRAEWRSVAPRSDARASAIMLREIDRLEADDLTTTGHVPAELLLLADRILPGDEAQQREPASRWLVREDGPGHRGFSGYSDRLRVRLSDKALVLQER